MDDTYLAVLFGAVGLKFLHSGLSLRSSLTKAREWPVTDGAVIQSEVIRDPNGFWNPDIVYRYVVHGTTFESAIINLDGEVRVGYSDRLARRKVEKYPLHSRVAVHYSLEDPTMAFLETSPSSASKFRLITGSALLLAGITFVLQAAF